jgi:hypothetical protein
VDVGGVDLQDLEPHSSVVDQDLVALLDVAGQSGVRRRADLGVARDRARGDRELLALGEQVRAALHLPEPDLRALQVGDDAHAVTGLVGGPAHHLVHLLVVGVRAVAEVHPGDVHAGVHEVPDSLRRVHCRPEGADNLRSTHDLDATGLPAGHPTPHWIVPNVGPERQTASGRSVGGIGAGNVVAPVR